MTGITGVRPAICRLGTQVERIATEESSKINGITKSINIDIAIGGTTVARINSAATEQAQTSLVSLNPSSFFKHVLAKIDHAKGTMTVESFFMPKFIAKRKIAELLQKFEIQNMSFLPDGKNSLANVSAKIAK